MRKVLPEQKVHQAAQAAISQFHNSAVQDVEAAIQKNEWVIVGMGHNPVVKGAKKYLTDRKVTFHSMDYGNYFSQWKLRLAIKLWSGWPTFPQVFHKGTLIGGLDDLKVYLK